MDGEIRLVPDTTRLIRLLPVFALVLGACDGTSVHQTVGGDMSVIDPNAMPIRRLGIISLSRFNDSQTGTSIDATLARFDHALAADLTVATTIPTLDTGSTSGNFDALGSRGLGPGFLSGPYATTDFELAGAGEAITLTAPAAPSDPVRQSACEQDDRRITARKGMCGLAFELRNPRR